MDEIPASLPAGTHIRTEPPVRERPVGGTPDPGALPWARWSLTGAAADRLETLQRAFWVALIPGAILFMAMQTFVYLRAGMIGTDSHAYWMAVQFPQTWYTKPPTYQDAFLYSPAFAQALWPIGQLSWQAFQAVWMASQLGVLVWLLAPMG